MRVGIDEQEPVARGAGCTGVARARDLVDRLEHHLGPRVPGDRSRGVGRVVVTDDEFCGAPGGFERHERVPDTPQRRGEAALLVEGWNDDRNLHLIWGGDPADARATVDPIVPDWPRLRRWT